MPSDKVPTPEMAVHLPSRSGTPSRQDCSRYYFGDEFCERLIPAPGELRSELSAALADGKAATLLTPYCTESGLQALSAALEAFAGVFPEGEVVVGEPGVLRLLRAGFPRLRPVLGRLYTSGLLHPYFGGKGVFRPGTRMFRFHQEKHRLSAEYLAFLAQEGITRAEFDNPFALPLFSAQLAGIGIATTFYYPYTYVTTSRRCLFASRGAVSSRMSLLGCSGECRTAALTLEDGQFPGQRIYVRGNAQFVLKKFSLTPAEAGRWGADRVVEFGV